MVHSKNSFFFITLFLVGLFIISACSSGPEAAQKKIDKMAQDMKADLPIMLDRDTRLVNVYTNKLELVSEYELVNYEPVEIEDQEIKNKIELYLQKKVCPGIRDELLSQGISSRYIYKGNNGQTIGDWLISPGDC